MTCCWIRGESRVRISLPMEHVVAMNSTSWCVRMGDGAIYESEINRLVNFRGAPYVTPEVHQWIVGQELFTAYAVHILPVKHGKLIRNTVVKDLSGMVKGTSSNAVVISFRSKQEAFMFKLAHGESSRYVL